MNIRETKNYHRFQAYHLNRSVRKISALVDSMSRYGFNPAYPIYAIPNGGKSMKVKDGHHRLEAAKKLGIPVKFVLQEDNGQTIQELNSTQKSWTQRDYLESYAKAGNQEYFFLMKYSERTGISTHVAMCMLAGLSSGTGGNNIVKKFKSGDFVATEQGLNAAGFVEECIAVLKENGCKFATNSHLVSAIVRVHLVKEVNRKTFISKLKSYTNLLKKQHCIDDYVENLGTIYNMRNRNKILLPVLVKGVIENRSLTKR